MNITFYDSSFCPDKIEEMLNALTDAMDKADANTKEWQKAIKKGDCFLFFRHSAERDWHDTEYGFKIYGKVLKNAYREEHLRNYRFCRCYSEACPEGETGDVHVCVTGGLLTREEFAERIKAL